MTLKLEHRQELVDGKIIEDKYVLNQTVNGVFTNCLYLSLPELQELKKLLNNMTEI